uniref:Protein FAM98A n=1 Tax=Strigamia maritima TaxID=126957 RepID=T1JGC5_STRMM
MEDDIFDSLEDLGYTGPLVENEAFKKAIEEGAKSVEYTKLIEWLSMELKVLSKLDDQVNAITTPEDSSSFVLEVSSFLKELNCPYKILTEGLPTQRLLNKTSRLCLIDFLCTELQAARMIAQNKPQLISKNMQVEIEESTTAADLKSMLITLGFPKPPANITPQQLFTKLENKVKELLSKMPSNYMSKPLFNGVLSDKQWLTIDEINKQLKNEYRLRREMLTKRLDVTIQSFKWSSRAKARDNDITQAFQAIRNKLTVDPDINLADVLAARETIAYMEKTSSASVRKNTKSAVNKVMIGSVPDRGGRPAEQQAPPPEMPSWQKRSDGGKRRNRIDDFQNRGGQGGGRGGRGGGRGGGDQRNRVQGGWSGKSQDSNWNQSGGYQGGGYQENRGYQSAGYQDSGIGYQTAYQDTSRGYQGSSGYQDTRGYQGSSGYQDTRGYQGSSGYQDNRGYQGSSGYQDNRGYQGSSGYQDNRGYQGGFQDGGQRGRAGRRGGRGGGGSGGSGYRANNYVDPNAAAYYQEPGQQYHPNVDYHYSGAR